MQVQAAQNYENDLQKSFAFVTGGRALAENLPLDADLQVEAEQPLTVDIKSLEGITVPEVDWSAILPDEKPRLDALAAHIPADQYACFFPSFGALLRVVDEAERMGAPILEIAQPRAQDAHVRERYERQLCLQIDELTRQLGPALITSVAVTGSDPYFPTGTDVAVLFETRTPELLLQTLRAKQNLALQREPGAEQTNVEVAGRLFGGVASPGRRICSYLFQLDGIVVVTNSPHQIRRLLDVERGEDALANLDEFAYFRGEYPLGEADESAFLVATDAAIRRWASATWRIGTSRRTRAAAELADLVAAHDAALLRDEITPAALSQPLDVPGSHGLRLTETGPVDSVYGSLHFLTPIAELSIDSVTEAEASAYSRFRRSYMQRWGQGFDPIAARLSVEPRRLGLSLTVVPLTVRSQYRSLMEVTGDTRLPAEAGDPHREAVLHATLALDPDSEPVRYANNFMRMINPEGTAPLTKWLGGWLTVYVDDDPVFDAALASDDPQEYLQERLFETPLAVEVEITSLSRATIFLAALRTYLDQVAPKALLWEPKEHGDASYVEISFREESGGQIAEQLHVYYHLTSGSLTASLSEEVLKRAIERKAAKGQAANEPAASNADQRAATPLGESMRLNAGRRAIDAIRAISNDSYTSTMQRRAWANLPILNEYRRLFPRRDPVEVYEELWGATLICPGGGEFVWDQTFHTMRSTVFGHPGEPLAAEDYPPVIREIERADFGLTFEHDGLQARLVIHREDAAEQ